MQPQYQQQQQGQQNRPYYDDRNQQFAPPQRQQQQQFTPSPRAQPIAQQPQSRMAQNGGYQQQQKAVPVITPAYQQLMAKLNVPPSQYPIAGAVVQQNKLPQSVFQGDTLKQQPPFQLQGQQQQSTFGTAAFQSGANGLPFPPVVTSDSVVYMVQFKMEYRYFVLSPLLFEAVEVNTFVITEGEKGEDLGLVVELLTLSKYVESRKKEQMTGQFEESERVLRHITKVANQFDLALLPEKFRDESIVIEHGNEIVKRGLMLPMLIVNAEYQFDRTRLTIHYTSNTRVDFRELVSKLFSVFKTTIWIKKVNSTHTFEVKHYAVLALRTGVVMMPSSPHGSQNSGGSGSGAKRSPTFYSHAMPAVRQSAVDFTEEEVLAQYIPDDSEDELQ
eukprot:gene32077-39622_t